jgi:hypothetical protein
MIKKRKLINSITVLLPFVFTVLIRTGVGFLVAALLAFLYALFFIFFVKCRRCGRLLTFHKGVSFLWIFRKCPHCGQEEPLDELKR